MRTDIGRCTHQRTTRRENRRKGTLWTASRHRAPSSHHRHTHLSCKAGEAKPRAPGSHHRVLWGFSGTRQTHRAHPAASRGADSPQTKPNKGSPKKGAAAPTGEETTKPGCYPPKSGLRQLGQAKPSSLRLTCPPRRLFCLPAEARGGQQRGKEPAQGERAAEQPHSPRCSSCRGRREEKQPQPCSYLSPPLAPRFGQLSSGHLPHTCGGTRSSINSAAAAAQGTGEGFPRCCPHKMLLVTPSTCSYGTGAAPSLLPGPISDAENAPGGRRAEQSEALLNPTFNSPQAGRSRKSPL